MRSSNLKGPLLQKKDDSTGDSTKSSDQGQKKPRTVHIDVYCTGTELESDSSSSDSSDSDEGTASTPQTVFESHKMRVTHKRANTAELPLIMRDKKTEIMKTLTQQSAQAKNVSDNEEDASTAYPSQLSSFSAMRDFSSSFSSVPPSFSTVSMSSYPIPEDYDSIANTSWKDTYSDLGSLMQSRSSITQTDSLDFVPRKLAEYSKTAGMTETPETEVKNPNLLGTPSVLSIQGSDSFEYANSDDRLRIKEMEHMWRKEDVLKRSEAPLLERKHMLQQRKMREYLTKRISDRELSKGISKDSESEGSDSSEKGWMFVKSDDKKLERDTTVRRPSKDNGKENNSKDEKTKKDKPKIKKSKKEQGSLSDSSSPSGDKSPSLAALRQRLSLNPNLRAPFMIIPGVYTDPRSIATKFGTVVPAFRKPGHHVGPAKNPNCLCEHCQAHFQNLGRSRTRSMGDSPTNPCTNWKEAFKTFGNKDAALAEQKYSDL